MNWRQVRSWPRWVLALLMVCGSLVAYRTIGLVEDALSHATTLPLWARENISTAVILGPLILLAFWLSRRSSRKQARRPAAATTTDRPPQG